MTAISKRLSQSSYCLQSGGAEGADSAFEISSSNKLIFLPWDGFNNKFSDNIQYIVPTFNQHFIEKYHPKPKLLSQGAKKLMSRNAYQVLGIDLNSPVEFVLCWTKDGKPSGGTGQAMRIALDYGIPIFNFYYGYEDFANYMLRQSHFVDK